MAELTLLLPQGSLVIADTFCHLPSELQEELCHRAAKFVSGQAKEFNLDAIVKSADLLHCDLKRSELESVANGIQQIFRMALQQNLDGESVLKYLQMTSAWSEPSLNIVKKVWSQQCEAMSVLRGLGVPIRRITLSCEIVLPVVDFQITSAFEAAQFVGVGQLVDFNWSLGMAMSSSNCRNLSSPYVSVVLRIAEPSGKINTRSFEMTVPEFQNFAKQIRAASKALETA